MEQAQSPQAVDLNILAKGYSYDEKSFAPLYARLAEKVAAYDVEFSPVLTAHLGHVKYRAEHFLLSEGYDADTARKIGHGFGFHDLGKILQDPTLWRQTAEKPIFTAEQKKEREKHGRLGLKVLDDTMAELGFVPDEDQKRHLDVVKHMMIYHHERLNGMGPERLPAHAIDGILRTIAIIDTVDGKMKANGLSAIFDDMSGTEGTKHYGQFDKDIVARYGAYYTSSPYAYTQPGLANKAHSL